MDAVETPPIVIESPASPSASARARQMEVGAGTFLLMGPSTSGVVGASLFLSYEVADNLYLRPSISAGETPASSAHATWAAGRIDACTRVPGNYTIYNGLQLDLCGGTDVGATYFVSGTQAGEPSQGRTLPYVDLGPSLALRGELGDRSAVWLRAYGGINVVRADFEDSQGVRQIGPLASFRLELGFSWGR